MKKHLHAAGVAVVLLCATQSSAAAGFNPNVNAAAISAHSFATNQRGYGDLKYSAETRALLDELKAVLAALQHDIAAMKTGSEGVATQVAQVRTALDRVEAHVNAVSQPRNNVWRSGPRRSGP